MRLGAKLNHFLSRYGYRLVKIRKAASADSNSVWQASLGTADHFLNADEEGLRLIASRAQREAMLRHIVVVNMIRYAVQGLRYNAIAIEDVEPDLRPANVQDVLASPPIEPDFSIFRYFIDPNETILDIGANIGLAVASILGSGCKSSILSFEPNPQHHPSLARLRAHLPGRFDFLPVGIGEASGTVRFVTPRVEGKALSTLSTADVTGSLDWTWPENIVAYCLDCVPEPEQPRIQFCETFWKIDTLDASIATPGIQVSVTRIAAIKLDVEGYEAKAIAGGHALLRQHRPLLMVEGANRVPGVDRQLTELGYCYADYDGGYLMRRDSISHRVNGFYLHRDRLADYMKSGLLLDTG